MPPIAPLVALALSLVVITAAPDVRAAETRTSKERLSSKAADEQRVDNCRVPLDQRGTVARPDCDTDMARPAAPDATRDNAADRSK